MKLMTTFEKKKNYIAHYRSLQQAIKNVLIVEKVHRVLQFKQSDWLAKYIELNTETRKKAKNDFEKEFFKIMNNAVFGKTMQSKRKEMKMELVSGFAELDISRNLMYDYHYYLMKNHYNDRIKLLYTDTDSLVYHIKSTDFYLDLASNPNLLGRLDTANLASDHPFYVSERKKSPGFFSDEVDSNIRVLCVEDKIICLQYICR
ncbi:hypothetical protein QTP88_015488 [Uroleucon formosanum]